MLKDASLPLPVMILDGSDDPSILRNIGLESVLDQLPQRSCLPLGNHACAPHPVATYPHIKALTVLTAQVVAVSVHTGG